MEHQMGFAPTTACLEGRDSTIELLMHETGGPGPDSNRQHPECKSGTLPIELPAHEKNCTSWFDSNKQPADYNNLDYCCLYRLHDTLFRCLSASAALPIELHGMQKDLLWEVPLHGNFHSLNGVNDVLVHCKEDLVLKQVQ